MSDRGTASATATPGSDGTNMSRIPLLPPPAGWAPAPAEAVAPLKRVKA
ncbi:hypothetical protein [Polyangium sp. y55x31]|nr:hypothetical protein [Polyangium sp. y55x31]MDI1478866.1 hypothetical protein [Polyangium sp. y55x31]